MKSNFAILRLPTWTVIGTIRRIECAFNALTCTVMHGGHELYVVRSDPHRLYQQCLLCGHQTAGWNVEQKDREVVR